jgi:hypothetical protein
MNGFLPVLQLADRPHPLPEGRRTVFAVALTSCAQHSWLGSLLQTSPPKTLPAVYLQICQPEGRMALRRVLGSLQPSDGKLVDPSGLPSAQDSCSSVPLNGTATGRAAFTAGLPSGAVDRDSLLWQGQPPYSKGSSSAAWPPDSPSSWDSQGGWTSHIVGSKFWQEFSGSIHVLCLSEIKYAMMAQSVVGVPGAMTLLCNLSTTVNLGMDTDELAEVRLLSLGGLRRCLQRLHVHSSFTNSTFPCMVLQCVAVCCSPPCT